MPHMAAAAVGCIIRRSLLDCRVVGVVEICFSRFGFEIASFKEGLIVVFEDAKLLELHCELSNFRHLLTAWLYFENY